MLKEKTKEIKEDYFKEGIAKVDEGDVNIAVDNQAEVANKINNAGMLKKYTEIGKLMYAMLKDYQKGIYKDVPWFTIAAIAFSFLYILNPLDIVPDFIPGLGYIDDFAIITFAIRFIETDIHKYLDYKLEETAS